MPKRFVRKDVLCRIPGLKSEDLDYWKTKGYVGGEARHIGSRKFFTYSRKDVEKISRMFELVSRGLSPAQAYEKIWREGKKPYELYDFKQPTRWSVRRGDFLVTESNDRFLLCPVTDVREDRIVSRHPQANLVLEKPYKTAIVLKTNGSYLVGKESELWFIY